LALKVDQSVEESLPEAEAEAVGRSKVWVLPELVMVKSLPAVPVANCWTCAERPLRAAMPVEKVVRAWARRVPSVETVRVWPERLSAMRRMARRSVAARVVAGTERVKSVMVGLALVTVTAGVAVPMAVKAEPSYL
jgi:hypothetical protein